MKDLGHAGSGRSSSILMFPTLLCQLFNVCVRTPTPSFAPNTMQNMTVIRGENVDLRCKVTDLGEFMASFSVAFLKAEDPPRLLSYDDIVFRQSDKYELKKLEVDEENELILTIKNIQENDAGPYTCQLNTNPVLKTVGYIHIKVPPLVSRSSTPSAVEVREGNNVTLSCEASGNPPPRVFWRRHDRQIIRFNGATGFGASIYNGSELFLQRVSRKSMSEYVCVATNGIPPDESWTVKLHVTFNIALVEPVVIPQSTIVEALCNVEAWPRAMVSWFFNDIEIFDPTRYMTEQSVSDRYKSVHVLEIRFVEKNQFGNYRCVAANDYGKNFAEIRLIEAPPLNMNSILLTEGSGAAANPDDEDSTERVDKNDLEMNAYLRRSRNEDEEEDIKVLDPVDEEPTMDTSSKLRLNEKSSAERQKRSSTLQYLATAILGAFLSTLQQRIFH
ncbi:hypothetical protein M3Y97_00438200 [Aphelenchoides bicaudatus]|nr:hypothetical protein M3Y97_00438200 [Aphelenchoides bicaudatus]